MTHQTNKLKLDSDYFENIVIYNALMDETYLSSIIDVVQPNFFKNTDIRTVFSIIAEYYQKRSTPPNLTELKSHLINEDQKKAFKNIVSSFKQLDTKYNQEELIESTEQFFKERAVYNAVLETANNYSKENSNIDANKTLEMFEKACNISLVDNLGHDYFTEIDKHINELKETRTCLPTGYKWLDKRLGGGFLADGRAMYVFSGVTNVGKSIILGNLAINAVKQDKTAIVISLEMSESVYSQRLSSQLTRIPIARLKEEADGLKEILYDYRNQHNKAKLFIKEYPPKSATVHTLKAFLKKLIIKKRIKPSIIVVDYVNLLQPTVVTGNSYTDIKLVAEQLRALSYIFKVPIVTATQLNRSAYDSLNPGLETTSESMGLSMTADFQASIWSSDADKELGILHVGIQKNRFGQNFGNVAFKIDYDTLAIDELEDDYVDNNQINDAESTLNKISKI